MSDTVYSYLPHHRTQARLNGEVHGPVKVNDQRPVHNGFARFNSWLGLKITLIVGTMLCGYIFAAIALLSLPSAIKSHNLTIIIAWISSNFLQLVLLPIIIVGQNVQATAADKRADATYKDADAVLHEAVQIQEHLLAQDKVLSAMVAKLEARAT